MSLPKTALRDTLPAPLWDGLVSVKRKLVNERLPEWMLSRRGRTSRWRMRAFRDWHQGERCSIIGSGPSLKQTDLSLLRNEVTLGLNRIYLLFEELGFSTTFLVSVNRLVIEQCAHDIVSLPWPESINWRARDLISFPPDLMFLRPRREPGFSTDITRGVWEGATVTYLAMQIGYYMGFQKVILSGVDHFFSTTGKPHTAVVSQGDDPYHFPPNYSGKGFRWQLPHLETSELAYGLAKEQFERACREIVDITIGGKQQVFRKVEYPGLFEGA